VAVDLGLNYYDEETDLSVSATLKNIGTEFSSFHDGEQTLPFVAQVGVSKGLEHLPLRLSLTLTDLTHWSSDDYYVDPAKEEKLSFSKKLLNHLIIGADYFITDNVSLSAGYNFRRGYELTTAGSAKGAGLTAGASLHLKRFKISGAYAKYHKSTSSLMFNVSYAL
jgi:opacity protein-like surface antigen